MVTAVATRQPDPSEQRACGTAMRASLRSERHVQSRVAAFFENLDSGETESRGGSAGSRAVQAAAGERAVRNITF